MKKLLFIAGIFVLINLNYSLFLKSNNLADYIYLNNQNNILITKINNLKHKNHQLSSEIRELSSSTHALENFARYNLGLVKKDEIFVHIINK